MSRAGVYKAASRGEWPTIKAPGRGAKNGVQYFLVPDKILHEINEILNGGKKAIASTENYQISKVTTLTPKTPESEHAYAVIDSETMIFVMASVDALMEKQDLKIAPAKKYELILLIYDYCKSTGKCTEEIVDRFLKLAG